MSGLSLAASPSIAPANTVFLGGGPVSERLTMVTPAHIELANGFVGDLTVNGNMLNTWTSWNPSFYSGTAGASTIPGSFTTAPDGTTNTAQHMAANTANGFHFISSGAFFPTGAIGGVPLIGGIPLRVVFVVKAAELTRCMVQIDDMQGLTLGNQQGNSNGAKTVFDLSGGQIGVANTAFGTGGSVAGPAQIVPLGNGFYQCWMDCQLNFGAGTSGTNGFRVSLWLDNGSGTAAQSTSFTGDGTSGIYIWKCCVLPPQAWSLTGTSFFDDFTDPAMGTIDLNNTLAPGFKWYIANSFTGHGFNALAVTPKAKFSQSGSILTINFSPTFHDSDLSMESGVQLTPGTNTVGTFFAIPALFETMCAYDVSVSGGAYNSTPTFWSTAIEPLTQPDPPANSVPYSELDFFEASSAGGPNTPHTSQHGGSAAGIGDPGGGSINNSAAGTVIQWYPLFQYGNNISVFDPGDGNIYKSNTPSASTSTPPHLNLAQWNLIGPLPANGVVMAFQSQNLLSTLWLPWNTPTGPLPLTMGGTIIQFFNNIAVGFGLFRYGPNVPVSQSQTPFWQVGDKYHYPLFFGCAQNASIYIDFARVIQ